MIDKEEIFFVCAFIDQQYRYGIGNFPDVRLEKSENKVGGMIFFLDTVNRSSETG